ncbi:hypothetical protein DPEC_G00364820 [Dallia pectoralis]|nr:hypothetical protein DPEC_G00364820 [Dallia pectoralis]
MCRAKDHPRSGRSNVFVQVLQDSSIPLRQPSIRSCPRVKSISWQECPYRAQRACSLNPVDDQRKSPAGTLKQKWVTVIIQDPALEPCFLDRTVSAPVLSAQEKLGVRNSRFGQGRSNGSRSG